MSEQNADNDAEVASVQGDEEVDQKADLDDLQLRSPDDLAAVDIEAVLNNRSEKELSRLVKVLHGSLQESVRELGRVKAEKSRLEDNLRSTQLYSALSRSATPSGEAGDASVPEVVRAQGQHILYLQYELGQREMALGQAVEEIRLKKAQIDNVTEQKQSLQEELNRLRPLLDREQHENASLRETVQNQLQRNLDRGSDESISLQLVDAIKERDEVISENQQLQRNVDMLRIRLEDAVQQIDQAASDHEFLKDQINDLERQNKNLIRENAKLNKPMASMDNRSESHVEPAETMEGLSPRTQAVRNNLEKINRRLDQWKGLLESEQLTNGRRSTANIEDEFVIENLKQKLQRRDSEISRLRWSLKAALSDMEDSANLIRSMKEESMEQNRGSARSISRLAPQAAVLQRLRDTEQAYDELKLEHERVQNELEKMKLGTLGLPEALAEVKSLKSQLTARDKYIQELVQQLNGHHAKNGRPRNQSVSVETSTNEKSITRDPTDQFSPKNGHLAKENSLLKRCMKEILNAFHASRVEVAYGRTIEIHVPLLEQLIQLYETGQRPNSVSSQRHTKSSIADSAIVSESFDQSFTATRPFTPKNNPDANVMEKIRELERDNAILRKRLSVPFASGVEQLPLSPLETRTFSIDQPEDRPRGFLIEYLDARPMESISDEQEPLLIGKRTSPSTDLKSLQEEHRKEVETLVRINADLRSDLEKAQQRLETLRSYFGDPKHFSMERTGPQSADQEVSPHTVEETGLPQSVLERRASGVGDTLVSFLENRVRRLEEELNEQRKRNDQERDELVALMTSQENDWIKKEIELNKEVAAMQKEMLQKDSQLDLLTNEIEKISEEMGKQEQDSQDAIESLRRLVSQRNERIKELEAAVERSRLEGAMNSSRTFTKALPGAAAQAQTDKKLAHVDSENLKALLAEKDEQIKRLSQAFQRFKEQITEDLTGKEAPDVQELETLKNRNQQLDHDNRAKSAAIKALERKVADLTGTVENLTEKTALAVNQKAIVSKSQWEERKRLDEVKTKLQEKVKAKDEQVRVREERLEHGKDVIVKLEKDRAQMEERMMVLSKKLDQTERKIRPTEQALQEAIREIERLSNNMNALSEIADLRDQQLKEAQETENELRSKLRHSEKHSAKTADYGKLEKQLKELSAELREKQSQIDELQRQRTFEAGNDQKPRAHRTKSTSTHQEKHVASERNMDDLGKSVETLKRIIDEQHSEILRLRQSTQEPIGRATKARSTSTLTKSTERPYQRDGTGERLEAVLSNQLRSILATDPAISQSLVPRNERGSDQEISIRLKGFADTQRRVRELEAQLRNILGDPMRPG